MFARPHSACPGGHVYEASVIPDQVFSSAFSSSRPVDLVSRSAALSSTALIPRTVKPVRSSTATTSRMTHPRSPQKYCSRPVYAHSERSTALVGPPPVPHRVAETPRATAATHRPVAAQCVQPFGDIDMSSIVNATDHPANVPLEEPLRDHLSADYLNAITTRLLESTNTNVAPEKQTNVEQRSLDYYSYDRFAPPISNATDPQQLPLRLPSVSTTADTMFDRHMNGRNSNASSSSRGSDPRNFSVSNASSVTYLTSSRRESVAQGASYRYPRDMQPYETRDPGECQAAEMLLQLSSEGTNSSRNPSHSPTEMNFRSHRQSTTYASTPAISPATSYATDHQRRHSQSRPVNEFRGSTPRLPSFSEAEKQRYEAYASRPLSLLSQEQYHDPLYEPLHRHSSSKERVTLPSSHEILNACTYECAPPLPPSLAHRLTLPPPSSLMEHRESAFADTRNHTETELVAEIIQAAAGNAKVKRDEQEDTDVESEIHFGLNPGSTGSKRKRADSQAVSPRSTANKTPRLDANGEPALVCRYESQGGCDGNESNFRCAVSHFFGRNKKESATIAELHEFVCCRKHYQRIKFHAEKRRAYFALQYDNILQMLARAQARNPELVFRIKLSKGLETACDRLRKVEESREPLSGWKRQGAKNKDSRKMYEHACIIRGRPELLSMLGPRKTFGQVRRYLDILKDTTRAHLDRYYSQFSEEEMSQQNIKNVEITSDLPCIEFLPPKLSELES